MNVFALSLVVLVAAAPRIEVSERSFDFGFGLVGRHYRHTFWIYNRGDAPLNIKSIRTFGNFTTTDLTKRRLAPGDSASFDFVFNTYGFFAERVKWAYIRSDDPRDSLLAVNVTVRLYKDYRRTPFEINPMMLDFHRLDSLREEVVLSISNVSDSDYRLRLVEVPAVLVKPEFTEQELGAGKDLTLSLRPRAGLHRATEFQSAVVFEAWTPTELVRFSVPLYLAPVRSGG